MKRLASWGAVCVGAVTVQLALAYRIFGRYIDSRNSSYGTYWAEGLGRITDTSGGWQALTPYYAWPVLVTYGGALVVLGTVIAVAVGRSIVLGERQAIAEREAAAEAQMQEAERILAESKEINRAAQEEVQAAMDQVATREEETAAQVQAVEARLQRSVGTNIGLRRQIQGLKKQVNEQGESNCVECQEAGSVFGCQGVPCLSIAFKIVRSLRIQAVRATLAVLPQPRSRS